MFQKVLGASLGPVLVAHDKFYGWLNAALTTVLDGQGDRVPSWLTADAVTWARSFLLIPTLLLLAGGHGILPAILVLLVDFGDFLDGVVWRWWAGRKAAGRPAGGATQLPLAADVLTGEDAQPIKFDAVYASRRAAGLASKWGQYFDAVADKAFLVPVWISMAVLPVGANSILSLVALWALAGIEAYSALIRTKRYFSDPVEVAEVAVADAANDSGVKSDEVGKAKQTLQMVGTALLLCPLGAWYLGLVLLFLAIPLAGESVRRKLVSRRIFAPLEIRGGGVDLAMLQYVAKAASLGSHLTVGVVSYDEVSLKDDMRLMAQVKDVDAVVALLQGDIAVNEAYLNDMGFDYLDYDAGLVAAGKVHFLAL
ncbi:uncharacterized protein AMSG_06932 [Thecamonas trahens ATCC 50062]|uniref:Uncharacterized protein n=1 Tax=Thecamonas trahens ATCC 50062 TaxID=461836 RepID=A0A0L0DDZ4_THETB|nr:hypothetical protein AMSG_06932 [Thecamonas trahens ATCC 50062]KNC50435.1 hypothetical protein AMSG_06932 [Thecamonas trahens ATCC 50062]|eukprot:XP_013756975.1 hypothetical protein AMSG_06932 [Thecamonas trahens ATCC 50062]